MKHLSTLVAFCLLTPALLVSTAPRANAHCEIPCGIYGDAMRFDMIEEHADTIAKSMRKIDELSDAEGKNYNQLVRWITNKEEHAVKVQDIVWQYFMTQRVKESDGNYEERVTLLHRMLVAAMKCKQTTDPDHVDELRELLEAFHGAYFDDEKEAHMEAHHAGDHHEGAME